MLFFIYVYVFDIYNDIVYDKVLDKKYYGI